MGRQEHLKTGSSRLENLQTQPRFEHPVFNNTSVVTEGWYPALKSKNLRKKQTASFNILNQRFVLFRAEDGTVKALDAFCPHMGADLVHGQVEGDGLRCYFHRWKFNGEGSCVDIPCVKERAPKKMMHGYPVTEKYGMIWVYAGPVARHEIPVPPGLDGEEVDWLFLKQCTLFAHHHVMMANGLDLQHFSAVHGLDIDFDFQVEERNPQVFDWSLQGEVPITGWRSRFARWLLGNTIRYKVRIAGGSVAAISYGIGAKLHGTGRTLPALHVFWGCVPLESGVSEVGIYIAFKKQRGPFAALKKFSLITTTLALLTLLKDDDVKAFPNMRFNTGQLVPADASVVKLVQMINRLPLAPWCSQTPKTERRTTDAGPQANA